MNFIHVWCLWVYARQQEWSINMLFIWVTFALASAVSADWSGGGEARVVDHRCRYTSTAAETTAAELFNLLMPAWAACRSAAKLRARSNNGPVIVVPRPGYATTLYSTLMVSSSQWTGSISLHYCKENKLKKLDSYLNRKKFFEEKFLF